MAMEGKEILITGGAGFIGSNMVERLVDKNSITVLDNFSATDDRYIRRFSDRKNFRVVKGDITMKETYKDLGHYDLVIHLAANSDVRFGSADPIIDFRTNDMGTVNLLDYMRTKDIPEIAFASSSTVYGEAEVIPTPETYGPYRPISSYGASKAAGESYIFAYSHYYSIRGSIFRFANVVGKNSTHGVIYDFIRKLQKNQAELEILGDGSQKKSYIHVTDCIDAMLFIHSLGLKTDVYNLGNTSVTSVLKIADGVCKAMGLKGVKYRFNPSADGRGWPGDVKVAQLSIEKITGLGWKNRYESDAAVELSIGEVLKAIWEK